MYQLTAKTNCGQRKLVDHPEDINMIFCDYFKLSIYFKTADMEIGIFITSF